MKDESEGRPFKEVVVLRPKMYSVKDAKKNIRKAKGVKKTVVEKEIRHEHYKEALFEKKQLWHGMNMLCSEGHEIYGLRVNKVSLSPFDTKRCISENSVHTMAYGHKAIGH